MKYFIDNDTWYKGQKLPPIKRKLLIVRPNKDGVTAYCVDKDGDDYTLPLSVIFEEVE